MEQEIRKHINASSKYIGVSYIMRKFDSVDQNHWKAKMKKKILGYFRTEREAALAYDKEAIKYGMKTNILKKNK